MIGLKRVVLDIAIKWLVHPLVGRIGQRPFGAVRKGDVAAMADDIVKAIKAASKARMNQM